MIVLRKNGDLMILRRSDTDPTYPLKWSLPGGKANHQEPPKKTVIRETHEEIGRKFPHLRVRKAFVWHGHIFQTGNTYEVSVYTTNITEVELSQVKLSKEHDDLDFINLSDLDTLSTNTSHDLAGEITPEIIRYLQRRKDTSL